MPADCAPELFELMMECWHDETEKRPTFANLVSRFDQFVKGHREVQFAFFNSARFIPFSPRANQEENPAFRRDKTFPSTANISQEQKLVTNRTAVKRRCRPLFPLRENRFLPCQIAEPR
jgi:hypothetical protein